MTQPVPRPSSYYAQENDCEPQYLTRRSLLLRLGALGLSVWGLPLLSGCPGGSTWKPASERMAEAAEGAAGGSAEMPAPELRVPVPAIAPGDVQEWRSGGLSGYLMQDSGGQWLAISRVCTHARCKVNFREGEQDFWCPCHKSRFDLAGNVLKGPAKRPLPHYPVREEGGMLVLDLRGAGAGDLVKADKKESGSPGDSNADDEDHGRGGDEGGAEQGWNP